MAKPNNIYQQKMDSLFNPDHMCAVYFATRSFSAVLKKEKGKQGLVVPMMHDLPLCKDDTDAMRSGMKRFGVTDNGGGKYDLDNDPKSMKVMAATTHLKHRFKDNPD